MTWVIGRDQNWTLLTALTVPSSSVTSLPMTNLIVRFFAFVTVAPDT